MVTNSGEHASNLMVPSFMQNKKSLTFAQNLHLGREERLFIAIKHQCSAGKDILLVTGQWMIECNGIGFGNVMLWTGQVVIQMPVIGQDQQPGCLFVQAADTG